MFSVNQFLPFSDLRVMNDLKVVLMGTPVYMQLGTEIWIHPNGEMGFPGASNVLRIHLQCRRPGFSLWIGKIPGEGNGYPLQYSCLENLHGQRSLVDYSHGVAKSRTRLSDFTFTCQMEKLMSLVLNKMIFMKVF